MDRFAVAVAAAAALRFLAGSAALPFFHSTDEQAHYDMVFKYAHGHIPRRLERHDPRANRCVALYGTYEFLNPPSSFDQGSIPAPIWARPAGEAAAEFRDRLDRWNARVDIESTRPPLYYAAAALWYSLGRALGQRGGDALYWIRFLNAPVIALTVLLAYYSMRRHFPGEPLYRLGAPLFIAAFPQDVFYAISNDVLSALLFGAAFFMLLETSRQPSPGAAFHGLAGFVAALAILAKWTNVAILAPAAVFMILSRGGGASRRAALICGAAIPVALWCSWVYHNQGALLGETATTAFAGWTPKPLTQILHHPLFTWRGSTYFTSAFLSTFWRGELQWHGRSATAGPLDIFYTISSCALVAIAALSLRRRNLPREERLACLGALAAMAAFVAQLVWASIRFDFGPYPYPSRAAPFLISGRLALGMLLPFLILYLRGLKTLTASWTDKTRIYLCATCCAIIFASGIYSLRPMIASRYNWLHFPAGPAVAAAFRCE